MSKLSLTLMAFLVVAIAQLSVPVSLIVNHELTIRKGTVFKFRTAPVDPSDPFRGRYVALQLEPETVGVPDGVAWKHNEKVYAVLESDTNGFTRVKRLDRSQPENEVALQVRIAWIDHQGKKVHIRWPGLDRYYMTETKAPEAESAYRAHSLRNNQSCHVTVRVRGTSGVVENLYVDNTPIQEWLRTHKQVARP